MAATRETGVLTVAAIRTRRDKSREYLFNERQRIFMLGERVAANEQLVRLLNVALVEKRPLKVALELRRGLIQRVVEPTKRELAEFTRNRVELENPDKVVPLDVGKIDPITFNLVEIYLKWRCFGLCTKIIPSYAKAKEIFDFCAELSCSLPGPYAVPPCIPFQYVHDGCYARAHQMRRIITTRYGHCCEKVFSFANQGLDSLAVRADKWGGCCVTWWYHVAPLVRVRVRLKGFPIGSLVLAMVIDPSMFDKPVLLSTWLSAQQNSACSPNAHVSMYSIQPGDAYGPLDYAGTSFSTDPAYAQTQMTLSDYSALTTC